MHARAECSAALKRQLPQFLANRIGKRDVGHNTASEESVFERLLRAVDELVRQHDVARLVTRLQRADCADTDDPCDTEFFHRPDVRAMVQFAGENAMPATAARNDGHLTPGTLRGQSTA